MPTPTLRDVHIDGALTAFSIAYTNGQYIGEGIFPRVPVEKKSDYYWNFPKQAWQRIDVGIRAPGVRARSADYDVTSASYVAITYALSKLIPDEVRQNADAPLRPDMEATDFVMDQLLRAQEKRIADMTTGGSALWAYSASPTTQWSASDAKPITDFENAIYGIVSSIGRMPNTAVFSYDVWRNLRNNSELLDRIRYTRDRAQLTASDLAAWFGFSNILIGTGLYDPALEGQTGSPQFIWGDSVWIGYVAPTPSLMTPSAGYLLEWNSRQIRRFRRDEEYTDVIEASHSVDEVISASDAGAVIYDAV